MPAIWWGCGAGRTRAGLSDRRRVLRWLLDMGSLLNGPSCLCGGLSSTRAYLSPNHSRTIAPDWSRYFDTNANDGQPWRTSACPPESGCTRLSQPQQLVELVRERDARSALAAPGARRAPSEDRACAGNANRTQLLKWAAGRRDAESRGVCVSVHFNPFQLFNTSIEVGWRNRVETGVAALLRSRNVTPSAIPDSEEVARAAQRILREHRAWESGVVHIRLGDRTKPELVRCTQPERMLRLMRERGLRSWIVMLYSPFDPSYRARLIQAANDLPKGANASSMRLIFETDLGLEMADNYFVYTVGVYLMQRATSRGACLETRFCDSACGGLWGRELVRSTL